jgi:hypothetical protein
MPDSASQLRPVDWDHFAELHRCEDGGGLLSAFKSVRSGTLAELVHVVASLPEQERGYYSIVKTGDHRLEHAEIMALAARPDLPAWD